MVQTKFFTRSSDNLELYKSNFIKALQMSKTVKLFNNEVILFFESWIKNQKNYIPREDIDNFGIHLNHIYKDKNFYNFIISQLKQVQNNGKIQEYSFNLISKLDDSARDFKKNNKKIEFKKTLEKNKLESQKEDEQEIQSILKKL